MRHRDAVRIWSFLLLTCSLAACSSGDDARPPSAPDGPAIDGVGINLAAVSYYATQTPFADVFRNRDAWQSTDGTTWNTEQIASIPADEDGYPLELPFNGQVVRASAFQPIRPDTFEVRWKGKGELSLSGGGVSIHSSGDNTLKFSLKRSLDEPLFVRIDRSDSSDRVRAIEIHTSQAYDAMFKASLAGFRVLRFMDWGATNGNPVTAWSERTTENQAQGSTRGASIEAMIDVANELHANMWYNVPHQADDDYIEQAAALIARRLSPDLQLFVEYSNENWNSIFPQVDWEAQRGIEAGLNAVGAYAGVDDSARFWAGLKYSVRRAAVAHAAFRAALGSERVVAVLAGQSPDSSVNDHLLSFYEDEAINPLGGRPDALAVAPYFGEIYHAEDDDPNQLTVERILADAKASLAKNVASDTRNNRAVADAHGVRLIAYEGGQHILAAGSLQEDEALIQRMIAANRDPRMGELYEQAHSAWRDNGGELIVYFNSCEAPSKFGFWGALEYQGQPPAAAPKWQALTALTEAGD